MYSWQDLDLNQPINWDHPLNRGRVAWWLAVPGRYGTPTWYDLVAAIPAALNCLGSSVPYWNTASNPGGLASLNFRGSGFSDYVDCGYRSSYSQPTMTIGAWINTSTTGVYQQILTRDDAPGSQRAWQFRVNSSNGVDFIVFIGGSAYTASTSGLTVTDGKWHRVIGSYDGSTIRVYIDGLLRGFFSVSGSIQAATNHLWMATDQNASGPPDLEFTGKLNDLFLAAGAWPQSLVTADHVLSQQMYPDVLNWQFLDALPIFPTAAPPNVLVRNFVYRPRFEPAFYE